MAETLKVPSVSLHDLLVSNRPPTSFEATIVRGTVLEIESSIKELNGEVLQVQSLLDELITKRDTLLARSKQHKAILLPIRYFPPEILSEIFTLCLLEDPFSIFGWHRLRKTRLCLGQICRRWKEIVESSPQLWSFISFGSLPLYTRGPSGVSLVTTWLGRSGACPLSIQLEHQMWDEQINTSVLDLLLPYCERWEHVTFAASPDMAKQLAGVKHRLPHLQSLSIDQVNQDSSWPQPLEAFQFAPRLRYLTVGYRLTADAIKLPWHSLTKLVIHNTSGHRAMQFLRNCPNIVECDLHVVSDDLPTGTPLSLAHLRTLDLATCSNWVNIFNFLTLPALRDFELVFVNDDASQSWKGRPQFITLLHRSACSLEKLTIDLDTKSLSEKDLILCLEATPTLTHLHIRDCATTAITRKVLNQMTYRDSNKKQSICLAPKLVDFRIDSYRKPYKDRSLSDMIQSRWEENWSSDSEGNSDATIHIARLRKVAIVIDHDAEVEPMPLTLDLLRNLKKRNMNASVEDSKGVSFL
jgi:hypothetical protein